MDNEMLEKCFFMYKIKGRTLESQSSALPGSLICHYPINIAQEKYIKSGISL